MTERGLRRVQIERAPGAPPEDDLVAVEEPLEIRVDGEPLVVTLRTPGHDVELAAGFLFTEGVIIDRGDLISIEPCADPLAHDPDNVVEARLSAAAAERHGAIDRARREHMAVAACGLCGKARLEDIYQRWPAITPRRFDLELLRRLPDLMIDHQTLFKQCGGVHAAALFDSHGSLLALREDVGRHNAVDKLIGWALLADHPPWRLPWRDEILVVSARAGFEIVQKAMMAAVPALVAVGAASSLAIDAAKRGGLDLYSFVRADRSNRSV